MRNQLIYIMLLAAALCCGCDDSETLTSSDLEEFRYSLPQGNHDYDTKILDFHQRTGKYILYRFEPSDVYFSPGSDWQEFYADTTLSRSWYTPGEDIYMANDSVYFAISGNVYPLDSYIYGTSGLWGIYTVTDEGEILYEYQQLRRGGVFRVAQSEDAYIGKQLAWLEEMFLDFYSDKLLKQGLPLKIILGRDLYYNSYLNDVKENFRSSFNNLIISYGDASFDLLTLLEKNTIKASINNWFIMDRLVSSFSFDAFYAVTNYYWAEGAGTRPMAAECYALGLLEEPGYYVTALEELQKNDLQSFVNMILGYSYDILVAEPADGDYNSRDLTGILHAKKDVNGLIRKKYDILIDEFKRVGIDIQEIGNLYN